MVRAIPEHRWPLREEIIFLKKTDFPPSSGWFSATPQQVVPKMWDTPSPLHAGIFSGLILCRLVASAEIICTLTLWCLENTISLKILSLVCVGCHCVWYRFTIWEWTFFSPPFSVFRVSVKYQLLQIKVSLMKVKRYILIYEYIGYIWICI